MNRDLCGGFGQVFIVSNKLDGSIYAIKKLYEADLPKQPLQLDKNFKKKLRECQAIMNMTHPNIIRCYNWWLESNENQYSIFIQMEYIGDYIQGSNNLIRYIKEELTKLSIDKRRIVAYEIILGIIKAIDYIHEMGYVHRDIRPENIFIQKPSIVNQQQFKSILGDFGLAKNLVYDIDEELQLPQLDKKPSEFMVKPMYSAEEVADNYDRYSDIYNLGLILHDLLTCQVKLVERQASHKQIKYGSLNQEFIQQFPIESEIIKFMTSFSQENRQTGQIQRMNYKSLMNDWKSSLSKLTASFS